MFIVLCLLQPQFPMQRAWVPLGLLSGSKGQFLFPADKSLTNQWAFLHSGLRFISVSKSCDISSSIISVRLHGETATRLCRMPQDNPL